MNTPNDAKDNQPGFATRCSDFLGCCGLNPASSKLYACRHNSATHVHPMFPTAPLSPGTQGHEPDTFILPETGASERVWGRVCSVDAFNLKPTAPAFVHHDHISPTHNWTHNRQRFFVYRALLTLRLPTLLPTSAASLFARSEGFAASVGGSFAPCRLGGSQDHAVSKFLNYIYIHTHIYIHIYFAYIRI